MILFRHAADLGLHLEKLKRGGRRIGFVPTMGALHEGHKSLIQASRLKADITVCSIFINPTQFNDPKDFEKYPVTISQDILKLEQAECHILFLPSVNEIYPQGTSSNKVYNLGEIEAVFEGYYRPGHFQGVCQVIDKLLHIVKPDSVFLGQKDYQQLIIISRLIRLLELPVEVIACPTLRESSGLAMSSRNMRLTDEQRQTASSIYKTLLHIKETITTQPIPSLEAHAREYLLNNGFQKVDYVSVVNADTLLPPSTFFKQSTTNLVVIAAAFIGGVRLIDNMIIQLTQTPPLNIASEPLS